MKYHLKSAAELREMYSKEEKVEKCYNIKDYKKQIKPIAIFQMSSFYAYIRQYFEAHCSNTGISNICIKQKIEPIRPNSNIINYRSLVTLYSLVLKIKGES